MIDYLIIKHVTTKYVHERKVRRSYFNYFVSVFHVLLSNK